MDGSKHTHLPQNKFLVTAFQLVGVIGDSACIFCTENQQWLCSGFCVRFWAQKLLSYTATVYDWC